MPTPPPPPRDWQAAFLSYLIPGLGQIVQGRTGKGVLFLVCLLSVFGYGVAKGQAKNVYLPPDLPGAPQSYIINNRNKGEGLAIPVPRGVLTSLWNRPQFAGQFCIGAAAWPALWQFFTYDDTKERGPLFGTYMRPLSEYEVNKLQRDGDKHWDLAWVYTVIAGILNVLVIYDAFAGPAFTPPDDAPEAAT